MKKILLISISLLILLSLLSSCARKVVVNFADFNGDIYISEETTIGSKLNEPSNPINRDYDFLGWFLDKDFEKEFDFSSKIEEGMTLFSKWKLKGLTITQFAGKNTLVEYSGRASIIIIPKEIEVIGYRAFMRNENIKELYFEKGSQLELIEESAFFETTLEKVVFPSSLKEIGLIAFGESANLKSIDFGEASKLEIIGDSAFRSAQIEKILIPDNVVLIGKAAFSYNVNLRDIKFGEDSKLKSIGESAFESTGFKEILLPKVETIGMAAFQSSSLESILIPNTVMQIGPDCFRFSNVKKVEFEEGSIIEVIDTFSFSLMEFLEDFTIPASVKIIKGQAFQRDPNLKVVKFEKNSKIYDIAPNAFDSNVTLEYLR